MPKHIQHEYIENKQLNIVLTLTVYANLKYKVNEIKIKN